MFPDTAEYKSKRKHPIGHDHLIGTVKVLKASYKNNKVFMYEVEFTDDCKFWVQPDELMFK